MPDPLRTDYAFPNLQELVNAPQWTELQLPGPGVVVVDTPRPRTFSCRVIDSSLEFALGRVMRVPQTVDARRMLTERVAEACVRLPPDRQFALATMVSLGIGGYALINQTDVAEKLRNATFSVPMPIDQLGVAGDLQIRVQLGEFKPAGGSIEYHRKLGGGDFGATGFYDYRGDDVPANVGVILRWSTRF